MYLEKLEIQGFKSFANKTTLEFNRELTAIVGPNGSGKSNIADAVRWVLGEQSLKVLRGKKSQDVIFAGSDKKSRLGMAEVNLYLNNEDGKAPIDYSQVVISRRIYRDGESEYLINKNKVRLQDIQMLMAKSSFGQRSYSIVGQGMVDSILTSSPQERKEFFDEATGVRQYQLKREQSLNKLERAFDNLQQSQQLIKEIEPRLRSLTRQMRRLNEREEIENDLKKLQKEYYSVIKNELNSKLETKQNDFNSVEKERLALEDELTSLQQQLTKIESEDTRSQAFHDMERKYSTLVTEKNSLLQEISLLQGKMDLELTSQGKGNLVWLRKKSEELALRLTALHEQQTDAKQKETKSKEALDKKIKEQEAVVEEFNNIKNKLLTVQNSANPQNNIEAFKQKINNLQNKYKIFIDNLQKSKNEDDIKTIKQEANEIADLINQINDQIDDVAIADAQEIAWLEQKMDQFLTSKDTLVDEINKLKLDLEMARSKHQTLDNQIKTILEEKEKIDQELRASTADDNDEQREILKKQKQNLENKLTEIDASLTIVKKEIDGFNEQSQAKQDNLIKIQKQSQQIQIELNKKSNQLNTINVETAKLETRLEDVNKEIQEEMGNQWHSVEVVEEIDTNQHREKINSLKNKMALIGGIDEAVPDEYKEVKERFDFLDDQASDLENSIESLKNIIKELDEKIGKQFKENFNTINEEFQKYFQVLFNGGKANLVLRQNDDKEEKEDNEASEDEEDKKEEEINIIKKLKKTLQATEIDIKASPPGKKIDSINTLSGGEKAMTAIALICAIISANPSPFVFLDEVDAALDEANAGRYVAIINELSNKTQFIAVTHNRVTMHHASILYGVTMGNDSVSRLLSVNLREAEEKYSQ